MLNYKQLIFRRFFYRLIPVDNCCLYAFRIFTGKRYGIWRFSISKLFKKPAEAVLTAETKKRMGEYLSNLSRTLNGGNGVINHF